MAIADGRPGKEAGIIGTGAGSVGQLRVKTG